MSITQELSPAALAPANLHRIAARVSEGMAGAYARWQTRRVFAKLTDAQLRDVGIDRATMRGDWPEIGVEAGLMARLNEMR